MTQSNLFGQLKAAALILASGLLTVTPMAAQAGDADNGKKLASAEGKGCAACHGADGNSGTPTFPILAGQYEDYLVHALKQYRSGERQNAIMGASANLTDEEIDDLAAWFASQDSKLQYVK